MFSFLLSLFGCNGQSSNDKTNSDKDTVNQEMSKRLEDFRNRPIYKNLTSTIFDTISDNNLEQAVMDNIWAKMKKDLSNEFEVVSNLSQPRQAIYIIWQIEAEVNNGGFNQFYFNSSGQFADKSENAFKQIGSIKFTDLMHRANETFNKNKEQITKEQDGTIEGFSKSYNENPLNKLDSEFYKTYESEDLSKLKVEFMRKYKADFIDN